MKKQKNTPQLSRNHTKQKNKFQVYNRLKCERQILRCIEETEISVQEKLYLNKPKN